MQHTGPQHPLDSSLVDRLVEAACHAREQAWAPYSGFRVGAAVAAGGSVFIGCNVENAAYPLCVCAERHAIAAAVVAGITSIDGLAVVADTVEPAPPCGACRQVMAEFGDFPVIMASASNDRRVIVNVSELLPRAFGSGHLAGTE